MDSRENAWSSGQAQNKMSRATTEGMNELTQRLSSQIQKISQNVTSIQRMVAQLGTQHDSEILRQKLHEMQHNTHTLSQETMEALRNLPALPLPLNNVEQRQWKLHRERLTNDFSVVLNNFQAVQRSAAQKEKESVRRARVDSVIEGVLPGGEVHEPSATEQTLKLQIEQNVDVKTIKEREQVIRQLESDIMDVNQIFKDLALMVHEQGEIVDSIEANVDSAQVNIDQGSTQIQRAMEYQSKTRRKRFYCTILLALVILIIILIIYLSVPHQ